MFRQQFKTNIQLISLSGFEENNTPTIARSAFIPLSFSIIADCITSSFGSVIPIEIGFGTIEYKDLHLKSYYFLNPRIFNKLTDYHRMIVNNNHGFIIDLDASKLLNDAEQESLAILLDNIQINDSSVKDDNKLLDAKCNHHRPVLFLPIVLHSSNSSMVEQLKKQVQDIVEECKFDKNQICFATIYGPDCTEKPSAEDENDLYPSLEWLFSKSITV